MKLILIKDLEGNDFTIDPNSIVKIIENEEHTLVETIFENILTKSSKLIIENSIHDCKLP